MREINITQSIAGLYLKNPFILASGIMDTTAETMLRLAPYAGAIITKSIGLEERKGYDNPVIFEFSHGLLNAMGLPNPGIEKFRSEMEKLRSAETPVIGSIFGKDEHEFSILAQKMEAYGARAVELNLSCPHARGYGMEIGRNPENVRKIVHAVKRTVGIPVLAKLTPNVSDIVEIGLAAENGGADAVVAINTVRAMRIDIEFARSVLSAGFGGYSGPGILPIGIRCVYELKQHLNVPVIGCGGIETWQDAVEYFLAGACAVEIGSALRKDITIFKKLEAGLVRYMKRKGYTTMDEVIALAHKNR